MTAERGPMTNDVEDQYGGDIQDVVLISSQMDCRCPLPDDISQHQTVKTADGRDNLMCQLLNL